MTDWICRECQRPGNAADEVGMGRCPKCGHEIDELDELAGARATIAGLRGQLTAERAARERLVAEWRAAADWYEQHNLAGLSHYPRQFADQLAALDKPEGA